MDNQLIRILYILLILSGCMRLHAQYSTDNKRAIGKFEMARRNYQLMDYQHAEANLLEALKIDASFVEAYLLLGQMYAENHQLEQSIDAYERAVEIDPSSYPRLYYFLGKNQLSIGRYAEAKKNIELFMSTGIPEGELEELCRKYLKNCEFGIEALKHPVPFEPVNLGPGVNSEYDEYWPSLSADERMLVFTVLLPPEHRTAGTNLLRQEDFFYSIRENGQWTKARNAGPPLNTPNNEGAQTITGDGKTLVFTACNRDDGMGLCDLYISENLGGHWSVPVNMGRVINTAVSEKQPSISADGRTLYFISNRPGGYGSFDIWYSQKSEDGHWQEPVNIGDSINTPGVDQSPFIHPDNKTLYFSSDGWPGMGGYDLFVSRRHSTGEWSTPVNLGYPINTYHHEEGMIVNALGNRAYFSSNRLEGRGRDIFEFELYQEVRPVLVSYMKGTVYDALSRRKLEASFELIDLNTGEVIMKSSSRRPDGDFLICIPADADYALNVSKQGYLFYSDNFSMDRIYGRTEPFLMDIPLSPIRTGEKIILKNVFFDHDSYTLKDQSRVELDRLIDFLKGNPSLKVELSGHTDNTGTREYNQELSEKRAGEVVRYLVENSIDPSRISHRGYGMEQPVASNDTEEGRAANRRTELKIISE